MKRDDDVIVFFIWRCVLLGVEEVLRTGGELDPCTAMASSAQLRLMSDLKAICNEPPEGCSASPYCDENLFVWSATVFGPEDTPWEDMAGELSPNKILRSTSGSNSSTGDLVGGLNSNLHGEDLDEQPRKDPLTAAFSSLFQNVAKIVHSQLQCSTESLELLEKMNLRTADEYNEYGDFAAGLRVFVERLKLKNDSFEQFSQQIDEIESEILELESAVSFLNNHTSALETKLRKAYTEGLID